MMLLRNVNKKTGKTLITRQGKGFPGGLIIEYGIRTSVLI